MNIFGATSGTGVEVNSDNDLKVQVRSAAWTPNGGSYQVVASLTPSGALGTTLWTSAGAITAPTWKGCMCLLQNGQVLLACGNTSTSCSLFNPQTGVWTATGSTINNVLSGSMCLLPNGKVLLVCGNTGENCNLYDPQTGTWASAAKLTSNVLGGPMCLLPSGQVLVVSSAVDGSFLYDYQSNTWASSGGFSVASTSGAMCLLPNGNALFVNGGSATCYVNYPSMGGFLSTGALATSFSSGNMIMLPNGFPLVICGAGTAVNYYNPSTSTWTAGGSLNNTFASGSTCLLPSGKIIVACGNNSTNSAIQSSNTLTSSFSGGGTVSSNVEFGCMCLLPSGHILLACGGSSATTNSSIFIPPSGFVPPGSDIFSMYWNNPNKVCLIRKIRVQAVDITVGNSGVFDLALFFARNYTTPDSGVGSFGLPYNSYGGTSPGSGGNAPPSVALAPSGNYSGSMMSATDIPLGNINSNKARTSMSQAQVADLRFGQGAALAQGVYSLDAAPISRVYGYVDSLTVGAQLLGQGTNGSGFVELLDRPPGMHPVVLAQNEGLIIQTTAGFNNVSTSINIEIEWEEVSSY